ncbi:MAG: hypothetical protein WD080_10200 [Egibacteraceae bacterium]
MNLRIVGLIAVGILLVIGVAVVLTQGDGEDDRVTVPPVEEREQMTPEERAAALLDSMPDGEHQGRLLTIDASTVTFRLVEVLRGDAAVEAAREQGALAPDGSLPGDAYARDTFETVTLPLADEPAITIQVCTPGCQEVPTTGEALATGEAVPGGQGENVFVFRVSQGKVASLTELQL